MDWDQERKAGKAVHTCVLIFVLLFAVFWTVMVISSGVWFMAIFGLLFAGIAIYQLYMVHKYSKKKEQDPWQQDQHKTYTSAENIDSGCRHCPYCGEEVEQYFQFCPICGRRL